MATGFGEIIGSKGDVAQLVERLLCKQDVRGSTPLVSKANANGGPGRGRVRD